jgi:hypothetical protein
MEYVFEEASSFYSAAKCYDSVAISRVLDNSGVQKRHAGRLPRRDDHELSPVELQRVERRRERNRTAAARCRVRRVEKEQILREQVAQLGAETENLRDVNCGLKDELERLRFQLQSSQQEQNVVINNCENYAVTFTPLVADKTFSFPLISNDVQKAVRQQSLTEFNKLMAIL